MPVFVRDPALIDGGGARVERSESSLAALAADTAGALVVCAGDPAEERLEALRRYETARGAGG